MAVELCSETIPMSPRFSFSQGFCESEIVPNQKVPVGMDSSSDFEFDIGTSFDHECYSPAGELFSNGKILPIQIKKKTVFLKQMEKSVIPPPDPPAATLQPATNEAKENESSKSTFWGFRRSSSLNCVTGYKQSLCPSHPSKLSLLPRSKSTGSAPNSKPAPALKYQKGKPPLQCPSSTNGQKPPLMKKTTYAFGHHGNGVSINPVLNVPSVNLFCSGSFLRSIWIGSSSSRNVVRRTNSV